LFLIIARFLSVWSATPFPIDLVTSDSMYPTLMEGDVVAWTPIRIQDIKTGDVIVFKSVVNWPDEKIVVHRVSDITANSKGDVLLVTKGDKNEFTDQAGPHIPEDYIRKSNLMGKVVSIGQTPLRIPLVGVIGIWLNQGVEILSQPTASKDSVSYIGVFAPLTISAVILVVLIFVLPEKAKTVKEKLRFFIFGPHPLNLKKTIFAFLVAYIIFLTFIHAFAFDSLSASVGVNANSEDAGVEFGRIKPGYESTLREIPVINPSAMPVKGFVFGSGDLSKFITKKTFNLDRGGGVSVPVRAVASEDCRDGVYSGNIMVFSSPFWMMYSDDTIMFLYNWDPGAAIFILDLLTAFILTGLTLLMLTSITFFGDRVAILLVDRSWVHPSKLVLGNNVIRRFRTVKKKTKRALGKSMGWILNTEYKNVEKKEKFFAEYGKSIISSFVIIPILLLIGDPMTAMMLSVLIGGILAYSISCKVRRKIVLTVLLTMIIATIHMIIQSNVIILGKEAETLEMMALSVGVIGVYLLIFTLLLIPLSAIVWYITHIIRNVKEQKDPLLSLEGSCDL
jgi:signal peptidase I